MSANTILTSIVTGGANSHATTAEEANVIATDFVTQGVVGNIVVNSGSGGSGSFCVNADGTPDMGVTVKAGQAYISAAPSGQNTQVLRARAAADYTAYTINANASGSTKYDWVYLKVDPTNANVPASDASNVTSIYTSRSSSNTADNGTPPTYGVLLAIITVANGASSITNSNITDKRTTASLSSAAGSLTTTQLSTGQDGIVQAAGADTNVNLNLKAKGTGLIKQTGVEVQAVTTNTNASNVFEQSGWTYINPASGSTTTKAITFPVAFPNAVLTIEHGIIGARTAGVPGAITDFNVGIGGENLQTSVSTAVSTSGVTFQVFKSTAFSSASTYYGVWWRAKGN